jgi:hypothetical protein
MQNGNLVLKPLEAHLTHNTEFIGKMSPYLKVILGNDFKTTPAAKKMHLNPCWDCELVFRYHGEMSLRLELWNKELLSRDDLIGNGTLDLSSILQTGSFQGDVPLYFKDRDAGFVRLSLSFFPDSSGYATGGSTLLASRPVDSTLLAGTTSVPLEQTQTYGQTYGQTMGQSLPLAKEQGLYQSGFGSQQVLGTQSVLPGSTGYGLNETTFLPQSQMSTARSTQILPGSQILQTNTMEPIVHKETTRITEQPVYVHQRPVIHEKTIIIEKPIITEKTIIEKEVSIIKEMPELHEKSYFHKVEPVVIRENPIVQTVQASFENLKLEGEPIITRQSEVRREAAQVRIEQPEIFQKEIVYERPIIHEKDIIHLERPIWVEKPEIREIPVSRNEGSILLQEPLMRREMVTDVIPPDGILHSQRVVVQENPTFVKERPELFERDIYIEKPIIHEQPVIYTEKQEIHERPEFIEKRGFVRAEQPIVEKVEQVLIRAEPVRVSQPTVIQQQTTTTTQQFNQMTDLA